MADELKTTDLSENPAVGTSGEMVLRLRNAIGIVALGLVLAGCVDTSASPDYLANTVAPDPVSLIRAVSHHTESWGQGSGSYYGPDGSWSAVNITEGSIGRGRWYVTDQSSLCTEANWSWRQDFGTATGETLVSCRYFRSDAEGQMWSTTEGLSGPWLPFDFAAFERGNQIAAQFAWFAERLRLSQ